MVGREINLLSALPKRVKRDISARKHDKERNRKLALKFEREYFDGPREQGYGGYYYDGRWIPVARKIVDHFGLRAGDRVLDVGCAKGFLVKDLLDVCPGLEVFGLDVSSYALHHTPNETVGRFVVASADELPFVNDSFETVISINTVHNLEPERCLKALAEIERLAPGRAFVQVDAYRSHRERELFEDWMLTARTYGSPKDWRSMFSRAGYSGDYYWTILEEDPEILIT